MLPKIQIGKLSTNKSLIDFSRIQLGAERDNHKIMVEIREYGEGGKGTKAVANAFLDLSELHLIVHDILYFLFPKSWHKKNNEKGEFYSYDIYGGGSKNGTIWARHFQIQYDLSSSRFVFRIREGEGVKNNKGGIQLKETHSQAMTFQQLSDMRKLSKQIESFILALTYKELQDETFRLWETYTSEKAEKGG